MTARELMDRAKSAYPGRKIFVDHVFRSYSLSDKQNDEYELYSLAIFSQYAESDDMQFKGSSWDEVYAKYCQMCAK